MKEIHFNNTKIFNYTIFLLCSCLCAWQVGIAIDHYRNQPVVNNIKLEIIDKFFRPPITICHSHFPIKEIHTMFEPFDTENSSYLDISISDPKINSANFFNLFNIHDLIDLTIQHISCSFAVNKSECQVNVDNGDSIESIATLSVLGSCMGFKEFSEYYFFVSKTASYRLTVKANDIATHLTSLRILFDFGEIEGGFVNPLELLHGIIIPYPGKAFISILSMQESHHLNTAQNPCTDDKSIVRDCINQKLIERVPCGMPFIYGHNMPDCDKISDILNTLTTAQQFLFQEALHVCPAPRVCNEVLYKFAPEIFNFGKFKYSTNEFRFLTNVKTISIEIYAYTLLDMISDIVGNVGFIVGLSLIGIFRDSGKVLLKTKATKKQIDVFLSKSGCYWMVDFLHLVCFGVCCGLFLWQAALCIQRYFEYPITNEIRIENLKKFKFPAVTYCSTRLVFKQYLRQLRRVTFLNSGLEVTDESNDGIPFVKFNLSSEKIANIIGIRESEISVKLPDCSFAVNETYCQQIQKSGLKRPSIPFYVSPGGRCAVSTLDAEFRSNSESALTFHLHKYISLFPVNWTQFTVLVHNHNIRHRHNYFIGTNSREFITHYYNDVYDFEISIVSMSKHIVLNRTQNPCTTELDAERKFDKCMDEHMERILDCRLMHLNSARLKPCLNFTIYTRSRDQEFDWIEHVGLRGCRFDRVCEKISYRFVILNKLSKTDTSQVRVKYVENVMEVVSERYVYTSSTFFANISNYLGFFLDLSLIGMFMLFVNGARSSVKFIKK